MAKDLTEVWKDKLPTAIDDAEMQELWLLLRLAEAKGRRVPMTELASAFGLPAIANAAQDFPGLHGFVDAHNEGREDNDPDLLKMPVEAPQTDDDGWYWMPPQLAPVFLRAVLDLLSPSPKSTAASSPAS